MGWEEELFGYLDDLEGQAAALYDAERAPSSPTASRAEYQQVTLASRLMASVDREVTLELLGVGAVTGRARPGSPPAGACSAGPARTGWSGWTPSPRCRAAPTAPSPRSPGRRSPGSA